VVGDSEQLPRLIELGPALDNAVLAAAGQPLPKLAAYLMTELFGSEYHPGQWVDLDTVASPLIPPNSGAKFGDPAPDGVRILSDIAAVEQGTVEQIVTRQTGRKAVRSRLLPSGLEGTSRAYTSSRS
jgi:hypothetical protein